MQYIYQYIYKTNLSTNLNAETVSLYCQEYFPHQVKCYIAKRLDLFIWGLTSLSTLYRSYHDG